MRRLRAGLVTLHSGGVGAPPGTTRGAREELADGGRLRLSEAWMRDKAMSRTGAEEPKEANTGREKRGPTP